MKITRGKVIKCVFIVTISRSIFFHIQLYTVDSNILPFWQGYQACWEFLYWLSIAVGRNGDEMAGGTDVDATGVGIGDAQGRGL